MVASASLGLLEAAATPTCAPDSKLQNSSWTVYNPPPKILASSEIQKVASASLGLLEAAATPTCAPDSNLPKIFLDYLQSTSKGFGFFCRSFTQLFGKMCQ